MSRSKFLILAVALAASAPALAAGPNVRPGHWKQVGGDDYDAAEPLQMCLSGRAIGVAGALSHCPNARTTTTATSITIDAACQVRRAQMSLHGVASGDFQTHYSADMTLTITPPAPGKPMQMRKHGEYRWVGPCAPGETPDDR